MYDDILSQKLKPKIGEFSDMSHIFSNDIFTPVLR